MTKLTCFLFFVLLLSLVRRLFYRNIRWMWLTVFCLFAGGWTLLYSDLLFILCGLGMTFCAALVCFQDLFSCSFSVWWLLAVPAFFGFSLPFAPLFCPDLLSRIAALSFAAVGLVMERRRWFGMADVIYLAVMGWILGAELTAAAVAFSCMMGLAWLALSRSFRRMIPFCSCLSIGFVLAFLSGTAGFLL
ncbi:MAG: hypothetical protein HUJ54_02680 [Erysipelotrichaceae bacterium]|nr:hypothetical protein [Erysipelotrichaceae bacterium]